MAESNFFYDDGRINWENVSSILKQVDESFLAAKHGSFLVQKQNELLNDFLKKYLNLLSYSKNIYYKNNPDLSLSLNLDGVQDEIFFFREEIDYQDRKLYRYTQKGSLPLLPDHNYRIDLHGMQKNILIRLYDGNGLEMRERARLMSGTHTNSIHFSSGGSASWFTLILETNSQDLPLGQLKITTSTEHKIVEDGGSFPTLPASGSAEASLSERIISRQEELRAPADLTAYPLSNQCREALERGKLRDWMKNLRVAAIMDEFTFRSYAPETDLLQLSPDDWKSEVESFKPDLLFVESAWKGKDALWENRFNARSEPLLNLLSWCREHKVPSIFWNKEDPVHFDLFLPLASLFDAIFTHDQDCVERYKKITGKDNVFHLHFGVQPLLFNPVEKYERIDGFSFAGSYYAKYPERCRNLRDFVQAIKKFKPVDIYDRQQGKGNERLSYPEFFQPHLRGGLPYSEIDKAYKGYKYAINLNSFKQSQSQCARRIYELLACNTAVASNFSRGARQIFGDLVFNGDDGEELLQWLKNLDEHPREFDKYRLLALRKVMSGNLYEDRLAALLCNLANMPAPDLSPLAVCVGIAANDNEARSIIDSFLRQKWRNKKLFLISANAGQRDVPAGDAITVMTRADFEKLLPSLDGEWFAPLAPADWYGEEYLTDLMLAVRYANFSMAGKSEFFAVKNGEIILVDEGKPYTWTGALNTASSIMNKDLFTDIFKTGKWKVEAKDGLLALDYFNYCQNGAAFDERKLEEVCGDLKGIFTGGGSGLPSPKQAEARSSADWKNLVKGERLFVEFDTDNNPLLEKAMTPSGELLLTSRQAEGETAFFQGLTYFPIKDILGDSQQLSVFMDGDSGANAFIRYKLYDEDGKNLKVGKKLLRKNDPIKLSSSARYVKFDLGIEGCGKLVVKALIFGNANINVPDIIRSPRKNLLIIDKSSLSEIDKLLSQHKLPADLEIFIYQDTGGAGFDRYGKHDLISGDREILRRLLIGNVFDNVYLDSSVKPLENEIYPYCANNSLHVMDALS